MLELEYRMNAVLGVKMGDLARPSVPGDAPHHVAKETRDRARRDVDLVARRGAQMNGGLYERARVRIELEDRVRGANEPGRIRLRRSLSGSRGESGVAAVYA
jgi:hypothetical protein